MAFLTKFAVPLTRPVIAAFTVISALERLEPVPLAPGHHREQLASTPLQIQLRLASCAPRWPRPTRPSPPRCVAAVPVVLLLIAFQRQIIRGLTAGAVK